MKFAIVAVLLSCLALHVQASSTSLCVAALRLLKSSATRTGTYTQRSIRSSLNKTCTKAWWSKWVGPVCQVRFDDTVGQDISVTLGNVCTCPSGSQCTVYTPNYCSDSRADTNLCNAKKFFSSCAAVTVYMCQTASTTTAEPTTTTTEPTTTTTEPTTTTSPTPAPTTQPPATTPTNGYVTLL